MRGQRTVKAAPRGSKLLEAALAVAVAVAFADSSIVVLALPELYLEFDASIIGVSWVVTAYNVAVAAAVFVLVPLAHRLSPMSLAAAGLLVFLAASIACAVSGGLATLVAARAVQGIGAALVLVASLPLLVALAGERGRAVAIWVGAGTLGAAAGPALGGLLTRAFDWRAIFAVQAPVAAIALGAALHRTPRADFATPHRTAGRPALAAAAALALAFASLVGGLFLAVLLLVTVWGLGPLAGAVVVSALPLAAVAVRPLSRSLSPREDVAAGAILLTAGLVALALLPATNVAYALAALALSGAGLGLALPPLTRATLPEGADLARTAAWSVGIRHFGLVAGLVAVSPVLAADLEDGAEHATLNATAVVLEAQLPLEHKLPIALDLYRQFQRTPEGDIPDLARPFDERVEDEPRVKEVRDELLGTVEAALTRAFRPSFGLSALFALLAGATAVALQRRSAA